MARRRSVPLADLARLPLSDLCAEIGQEQYAIAVDRAHGVDLADKKERIGDLRKLTHSRDPLDRLAALLYRRWHAED
jgi:hypothetical protein